MFGQVEAFFGRQIRIPRQILPLYMCFYEVFWEKIEFAKKFEFSFEGKKYRRRAESNPRFMDGQRKTYHFAMQYPTFFNSRWNGL